MIEGNAGGDYVSLRCAISASLAKPQILFTAANKTSSTLCTLCLVCGIGFVDRSTEAGTPVNAGFDAWKLGERCSAAFLFYGTLRVHKKWGRDPQLFQAL